MGFWQYRLFGYMFGIFGAAALFLAAVGVYGVLSFSVSQRTQEMGVRIALGANRLDVLGLVVRQGLTLAAIGVVLGLVGAFGITRVIQSLLYNVTADRSDQLRRGRALSGAHRRRWPAICRRVAPPTSIRSSRCATNRPLRWMGEDRRSN